MSSRSNIHYREFWDFPRMVIATSAEGTFLFWSRFDEALDDYVDHYEVWRMPELAAADLAVLRKHFTSVHLSACPICRSARCRSQSRDTTLLVGSPAVASNIRSTVWPNPAFERTARKRASLACGSLLATLVGRRSTRALSRPLVALLGVVVGGA